MLSLVNRAALANRAHSNAYLAYTSRALLSSSKEDAASSHYETLGVAPDATSGEIKTAFYEKSKLHHPDRSQSRQSAPIFQQMAEAYEVLGDPVRRRSYDSGRLGPGSGGATGAGRRVVAREAYEAQARKQGGRSTSGFLSGLIMEREQLDDRTRELSQLNRQRVSEDRQKQSYSYWEKDFMQKSRDLNITFVGLTVFGVSMAVCLHVYYLLHPEEKWDGANFRSRV